MQSSKTKLNVYCAEAVWGRVIDNRPAEGNWHIKSKVIKCRADADGAMVYIFDETRILAHCIEDALEVLHEQTITQKEKEIKELTRELYSLQNKVDDIEAEIEETEDEIGKRAKEVRELRAQIKQFQTLETATEDPNQIPLL